MACSTTTRVGEKIRLTLLSPRLNALPLGFFWLLGEDALQLVALKTSEAGCTDQGPDTSERIQLIGRALAPWLQSNITGPAAMASIADPFGSGMVRVVLIPIGYEGACGVLNFSAPLPPHGGGDLAAGILIAFQVPCLLCEER
jgi:hypothetical protein